MDLTKFHPDNLHKLDVEGLIEFKALNIDQIEELSKFDTNFKGYLVYRNKSNKLNSFPSTSNYSTVLGFLKQGNDIELISPRVLYNPTVSPIKVSNVVTETVEVEPMKLSDFMEKKESAPVEEEISTNEAETVTAISAPVEEVKQKKETKKASKK